MKAYGRLYDLFYDGLHRFSYSFVKSVEVAEEIVSDVFIKVWEIRGKLMEIENMRVYLYTIAKNFSLNYITKHYKNTIISLDTVEVEPVVALNGPAEICISADMVRQIRLVIGQLPPKCKLIFQLVKEEELTYKEVAAILDISPLTVRNQLAIAIRKISETLPAYLQPAFSLSNKFSPS